MVIEFQKFQKIARFNREVICTEKIDGSNGQIYIREAVAEDPTFEGDYDSQVEKDEKVYFVRAGSHNRWLTKGGEGDNFSFGAWVAGNAAELLNLGPGRHYGEWWGLGIQRTYNLAAERRFSLFNTYKWDDVYATNVGKMYDAKLCIAPACCRVVPVLWRGVLEDLNMPNLIGSLEDNGSAAALGFPNPEGVMVYHTAARLYLKRLIENDAAPKSAGVN